MEPLFEIIQKQQYASGFQPMIYFYIPILCFSNGKKIMGYSSKEKTMNIKYNLQPENVLNLVKVFSMASKVHHYDIKQILKVLLKNINLGR
ncbi:MAG: R.Pab1 family restriction endonuclease [Bdellovibrionales bacterium]|nr:R.Pab1 family restriction endonuclease [Bdellovibrionales bacterium]